MLNRLLESRKRVLLTIFILAVALRFCLPYVRETFVFHQPFIYYEDNVYKNSIYDEIFYNYTAKALMQGRGFSVNMNEIEKSNNYALILKDVPDMSAKFIALSMSSKKDLNYYAHRFIPPLYPIFLSICYGLFGVSTFAYFLPQVLLGSLTCLLVYFIAQEVFDAKVAVWAGMLVALYPDLIFWTYAVRTETLFIFLLCLAFLFLIRGNSRGNIYLIFLGGVFWGVASLTRMTILFFLPLILIWQYFILGDKKKSLFFVAILFVSFIFVLSPWTIRNYRVFNKLTPLTTEGGALLYDYFPKNQAAHLSVSPVPMFFSYVVHNSGKYISISLFRLMKYLGPITPSMNSFAKAYKLITWLFIFPLSLYGLVIATRRAWRANSLIILFIIYNILFHAAIYVDDGLVYRYPIQPFLCIFAAYAFFLLIKCVRPEV